MKIDIWKTQRDKAEFLPCGLKVLKGDTPYLFMMIWNPKAEKPFANYRFKDAAHRESYLQECIDKFENDKKIKAQWKAERLGTDEDLKKVKVGDIFSSSWGYDQTNVDFYQVIALNGRMATIQGIGCHNSLDQKSEMTCDYLMPAPNSFIAKPMIKRIQFYGGRPYFFIASYANAYPFEGKAKYQTNSLFGH